MLSLVLALVLPVGYMKPAVRDKAIEFDQEVVKVTRFLGMPRPEVRVVRGASNKVGAWVYTDGSNTIYVSEKALLEDADFLDFYAIHESCHLFSGSKFNRVLSPRELDLLEVKANACVVFVFDNTPAHKANGGWDGYISSAGSRNVRFYPLFVSRCLQERGGYRATNGAGR